jgi:predicted choloylglycine hydrolase
MTAIARAILNPQRLSGSPRERGLAQAMLPGIDATAIRAVLDERHAASRAVFESEAAQAYLAAQRAFIAQHCEPEFAELQGVCAGLGLPEDKLLALFHLTNLSGTFDIDGCSAWGRPRPGGGAMLAKNRDLSGPHRSFQETFLHLDPQARGGAMFCVGTLGVPGAYSSGMNEAGLALADTAIPAPRHAIGWPRYLLMTRLLMACRDVEEACAFIAGARHAGGGSLILADAGGAVAAVELLADGARITREAPAFRSNHFWCEAPEAVAARQKPAALRSTLGRRNTLAFHLAAGVGHGDVEEALSVMADHGSERREGLCRHGGEDGAHTVSSTIYETGLRRVTFSRGAPCEGRRESATLDQILADGTS